jgi:tetratricopeptide (TPR) repeat protein
LQAFSGSERPTGDSEVERFRLFESVVSGLANASAAHPILLVLDDLHWADKPSLLLLRHLARSNQMTRLFIVGTYRESDLVRTHPLSEVLGDLRRDRLFERVSLHGLDEEGVTELIAAWAQHDPPPAFARAVFTETEGNPFFVEEVLFHLAESGAVRQENGVWVATVAPDQMGIPEGVREVIGRRLSRLSEDANQALTVAAVIGREFDLDVLATIVERSEDELFETMEEAVRARIVAEVHDGLDRYRFAHALIRETLYDELSSGRKLRLHRKVAAALEAKLGDDIDAHLSMLAYHLVEAAPGGDVDRAVEFATRAGTRAMEALAYEEAVVSFRRALQALEFRDPPDEIRHADLLIDLAESTRCSGDLTAGRALNEQALAVARATADVEALARAAVAFSNTQSDGNFDPVRFHALNDALAGLGEGDSPLRAGLLAGFAFTIVDDATQRATVAEMAVDMARRLDDDLLLLDILQRTFAAVWNPATVEHRQHVVEEMRALTESTGDQRAAIDIEVWQIVRYLELGDVVGLDQAIATYLPLAEKSHHPVFLYWGDVIRSMRLLTKGEIAEAERLAVAAYEYGERSGNPVALNFFGAQLYAVRREQGRLAEMEPLVKDLVERNPNVPSWRCALAYLYAELGDRDQAAEHYGVVASTDFGLTFDQAWIIGIALLADTAGFLDDRSGAEILLAKLTPYADRIVDVGGLLDAYGSVRRSLGVLATVLERYDEAADHFERALVKNRELGDRWLVHTEIDFARMLLARGADGDVQHAKELLDDAVAVAASRGMIAAAAQATEVASALG